MNNPPSNPLGPERLGFSREEDVDLFVSMLAKFESGEISPDEWKQFRLLNGCYGQRQDDVQMMRVKVPQGILTARQLRVMGELGERFATGKGHITTRQNIQFHFVKLKDAEAFYRLAVDAGLTSKEACGNSVRNITQCPYAGVSALEPFDSSPYAEAMTRFLLRGQWSSGQPRKFKIAFGGCCGTDCIGGAFNDIGFYSRVENGVRGFRVNIGGGLSTQRRNAILVHEFLPAEKIFECAEAVLRVFHRTGDRQHKHKARLKFVIDKLGPEGFVAEYEKELRNVAADGGRPFVLPEPPPPVREKHVVPIPAPRADAELFYRKNVRTQRQEGYVAVTVKITLGDLTTTQWNGLADLVERYSGEEELRTTTDQNVVIRFVRREQLPAVHQALVDLGLAGVGPGTVVDVTSCPGAMSCKLAVTQSRGLASLVQEHLEARPELAEKAEKLAIKISGCPNTCGQHHVSGLGFQGGMKKIGGRSAPLYHLYIGGHVDADKATFGRIAAKIPARRAGVATERLIDLYDREKTPGEDPNVFFSRVDVARVKAALGDVLDIDEKSATPEDFVDLGETKSFEVVLQEGECAA